MAKKNQLTEPRKIYTAEQRENARKMYLRGLYLTEIAILLSIPVRTLEKWQTGEKWTLLKDCPDIKKRAFELKQSGRTAKRIAEILKIDPSTVWRYIKAYQSEQIKA